MKRLHAVPCMVLLALFAVGAAADPVTFLPLQCGDDEREDGSPGCQQETKFFAGAVSTSLHLKIGGDTAGCNSEWAVSAEFDLTPAPSRAVRSAALIVRKTGYSDNSQGFAYLGAFTYPATGELVTVDRADLTPETALSIVYPPAANVDLQFDVTAAIQALVGTGGTRAGILLAGVYSEVGYEDWISIGGINYTAPPRLVVNFERPIATTAVHWSAVRMLYR